MEILKYKKYLFFSLSLILLSIPLYIPFSIPLLELAYAQIIASILGVPYSYNVIITKCPIIISNECVGILSVLAFIALFLSYRLFIKEEKDVKKIIKPLIKGIILILVINFLRILFVTIISNFVNDCNIVKTIHIISWYLFSYVIIPYIAIYL